MIQVKIHQLLVSVDAFQVLCSKSLSAIVSFRLSKMAKRIDEELKQFNDVRLKKAAELGTLSEDKSKYEFSAEAGILFQQEIEKMQEEEIDLPFEKVKIEDIKSIDLEPKHFILLDWLVQE